MTEKATVEDLKNLNGFFTLVWIVSWFAGIYYYWFADSNNFAIGAFMVGIFALALSTLVGREIKQMAKKDFNVVA